MPSATLEVQSNNDLLIKFNDTITPFVITSNDIYIQIYGPKNEYEFTWKGKFQDSSTVLIEMDIATTITGNNEIIYLEFSLSNGFISIYSLRNVNPDITFNENLYEQESGTNTGSFGQTALYLYMVSVGLTILSSFGGNSMEMMWQFTNTLQLMYYLSVINVHFPSNLSRFFPYIHSSNADNPYLKSLTLFVIPANSFKGVEINDQLGDSSFYMNSADKLPYIVPALFLFIFVICIEICKPKTNE